MDWNASGMGQLIRLTLAEDSAKHDRTTESLIRPSWTVRSEIRAKQTGVVAGLLFAELIVRAFDRRCRFNPMVKDGDVVHKGTVMARLGGSARSVLTVERPVLNAIQHLSGIATFTHTQVKRLGHSKTRLLDTRKTIPGWRVLEKYAVRCGGGTNHRMSLSDAILVKDNHLEISRLAGRDWVADLKVYSKAHPKLSIQVEIKTEEDLKGVLELKPARVLLDNMPLPRLKKVIRVLRRAVPGTEIEISGGVTSEQLPRLGKLGVERISMGKLTHSAPAFDCSLDITHVDAR